ncbi:MAG TPA: TonB-dependent receptor, partial [Puia sp.]|nr:TonB-dependent receptor [Puia sp.]
LQEVQVSTLAGGGTDNGARRLEQRADIVQNLLSSRSIELSPDVTVGNAMQRISGVTLQAGPTGEGRYAIIRGMDQRYNAVLVNGVKIASPDDKYRFVPMDLFPSELLERLEVIKSLTPRMEGDAIGGTMNLVMKQAPDDFLLSANVAGGYSSIFSMRPFSAFNHGGVNVKSPAELNGNNYAATAANFPLSELHYHNIPNPINGTAGITIGNRFMQKRLGVLVSAAYQNFYRGSNSQFLIPSAQPDAVLPTAPGYASNPQQPAFTDAYDRQYSTQTNRIAINNTIDFVINPKNKLTLYNLYVHQNEFETRYTPDSTVGTNSSANFIDVDFQNRSTWTIQNIYNATLRGDHVLGSRLKLDWTGAFSDAHRNVPDQSWYDFNGNVSVNNSGKTTGIDSTTYGMSMNRLWRRNSDRDWQGLLNLTYTPRIARRDVELMAGGLYRSKTRDAYYNYYVLNPSYSTVEPFHSIDSVPFSFTTQGGGTGSQTAVNYNTYTAHEKIGAGYIQARFDLIRSLQVVGGVRVEHTLQDYSTAEPPNSDEGLGSIHYTDVLPSINLKYALNSRQNLRLSYFKSISRPSFADIEPYHYIGEFYDEIGNPYVKHTRADNLDLRYEFFPGLTDQFLIGAFYKDLQNPIEYFITRNGGPSALFIQPQNVRKATNYGLEAVASKYFGMFGISANYTYTHSRVTTPKLLYHYVGSSIQTDTVYQSRPLQGQADHIGNLALLFRDPHTGTNLQVALTYTGERIAQVSPYYNFDLWQKAYVQLDFSAEQRLTRRLSFYVKVNNLTNASSQLYIRFPNGQEYGPQLPYQSKASQTNVERNYYKLSFLAGFRFKL